MAVDYIDNNTFVQSIIDKTNAEKNKRNTNELGKDEFLNLLIMQLRYQDPLNPVDDKEFIAQMAQFSALEQMQNMNSNLIATKGFSMIGKYVYGTIKDDTTGIYKMVEGHVESVVMSGSNTYVVVDGMDVPIENIYNVADGYNPLASSLASYTHLIGFNVYGAVYDISTGEIVGVEGDVVSLAKGMYEDYAILDNVNVSVNGLNVNGVNETDRARLADYLAEKDAETDPEKRNVELFITDTNGKLVPVGATLKSYNVEIDGSITAVLDNLAIPVTSVSKIRQSDQASGGVVNDVGNIPSNVEDEAGEEGLGGVDEDDGAEVGEGDDDDVNNTGDIVDYTNMNDNDDLK